jgi:SAM-dependent methyltransferase
MTILVGARQSSPDLSRRSTETEWLDGAGADGAELEFFLRDLARFNGAMLGHRAVMTWLRCATKNAPRDRPLTLIDIGCGYGDLLRAIRRWSRKRGLPLRLIGLDCSRETVRIAQAASADADGIEYRVGNVFEFRPPEPIDFVVSSLLTHHLSDEEIVKFLGWMEMTARKGWLVYDLQRHVVPFFSSP